MSDRRHLVVINDDPVQLRLLKRVLEGGGHDVTDYLHSSEALADLAGDLSADLFVVDLHMPGIDGWKVCRLLRSPDFPAHNATPILIVSATFTGADVEAITADIGADAFLPLPFSREDLLEDVEDLLAGMQPRTRTRALIVEDDDGVARTLTRAFTAHGYEVHRVRTIREAMSLWANIGPDLVLLDYHLPDGTGIELLERLQTPSDRTVVLVMTGDTDPGLPVRLLELGADGYVRKPFDSEFLVELAGKARRERSLLRVESLLELRTQELKSSEIRYRSLFDAIPDLVLALDGSDRILRANDGAASELGPHLHDLLGRRLADFLPEDHMRAVATALEAVRASGSGRFETVLKRPGLSPLTVEVTAAAIEDTDESSVLMVARDLTERRRAEEERRQLDAQVQHAQRLESLGVLAGGIAHDFNNLLVGVMGNASLALLDTEAGSSVHDCIVQIETAARRAAELTQQILTFSGRGDAAMSPQDVSALVSEMGRLLAPAVSKKARLSYRLARSLPLVRGDASQLRQVFMNLIMNASDALGDAPGTISVRTAIVTLDEDDIRGHYLGERAAPGSYVLVEVTDDGCGMDEATRQQIFDPFFTTKFAGRGLGLAATMGIVRSHSGLILLNTGRNEGTEFRILLPALDKRTTSEREDTPAPGRPWGDGGSILVVDDEPSVRMLASTSLTRAGFRVLEAADGQEGLDLLEREDGIDLVVVDLTMPALGGIEVLEAIRSRRPDLPVLLSSGYLDDSVPAGTLDSGVTAFLPKPYAPSGLLESVSDLLRTATRRRERYATRLAR